LRTKSFSKISCAKLPMNYISAADGPRLRFQDFRRVTERGARFCDSRTTLHGLGVGCSSMGCRRATCLKGSHWRMVVLSMVPASIHLSLLPGKQLLERRLSSLPTLKSFLVLTPARLSVPSTCYLN